MHYSRDRILTTHVGSLPRSQLLCDMLLARDRGEDYDAGEYDRVVADAVCDVVARQRETGIDVPSDGEQSKVSYSTYMMDRGHIVFDGPSATLRNDPTKLEQLIGVVKA